MICRAIFVIIILFSCFDKGYAQIAPTTALLGVGGACYEMTAATGPQWSNLVGYWKFNEANGSATAADSSGHSLTATASGTPGLGAVGRLKTAAALDGTSGYFSVPYNSSLNLPTAWSISAWVKVNRTPQGCEMIVTADFNGGSVQFALGAAVDSTWRAGLYPGGWIVTPGYTPTIGKWVHLVGVYDGSVPILRLYVNGLLFGSTTSGVPSTIGTDSYPVTIGRRWDAVSPQFFGGTIDEVAIWKTPLTAAQVHSLYDQQSCGNN